MAYFAIIGYGKMGKEIEMHMQKLNHQVVAIIDNENDWQQQLISLQKADVAVEFSMPSMAERNVRRCLQNHLPVVSGTTGWHNCLPALLDEYRDSAVSFIYGTNFSIGANIFFDVNRYLAHLMNSQSQYDVTVDETHHIHKLDAPSGTAITIAETIISEMERKKGWALSDSEDQKDKILISSHRIGEVAGIHEVTYTSVYDSLQLTHTANSRRMLAEGAIRAALWLLHHPGIYNFSQIYQQV